LDELMGVDWGLGGQNQYDYLNSLQALGNARLQDAALAKDRYQMGQLQRQDAARPQILAAARGGDFKGAEDQAFGVGDMDALKFVGGLQEDQRRQVAAHADLIAGVAANLAKLPLNQRAAALAAAAPQLRAQGFTDDELRNADLSDAGLTGYLSAASSTKDALASYYKSQEPITVADGAQVFGATPMGGGARPVIAENPKDAPPARYQLSPDGTQWMLVPGTGGLPAGGVTMPSGAPSGQAVPVTGRTYGGWTPRARNGGDNSDAAVDNKIAGVAKLLGVDPNADISKLDPRTIAGALAFNEGGSGSVADRNNNPTNLTDGKGGYRNFSTKEAGLSAAAEQVRRNLARGQTTIRTMIEGLPADGRSQRSPTAPQGALATSIPSGLKPQDKSYRILTPQEAQARGLDSSSRWQVGPNNQITALPSKGDKPLTESQGKAAGYLARAVAAADTLNSIPGGSYKPEEVSVALYGLSNTNPLRRNMSPSAQRVLSAQESFVLAILRQDSGAAINQDEIRSAMRTYFPQPGDSPQVQADKRRQREAAIRGLRIAAGPGSDSVRGQIPPGSGDRRSSAPSPGWGKATVVQ
jgi:hypothetical protein